MDEMIKRRILTPNIDRKHNHSPIPPFNPLNKSSDRRYTSSSDDTPTRQTTPKKPRRKNSSRGSSRDRHSPKSFTKETITLDVPTLPHITRTGTELSINSDERKRNIEETEQFLKQCEQRHNEDVEFSKTLERKKSQHAGEVQRSPFTIRKFENPNINPGQDPKVNLHHLPISSSSDVQTEDDIPCTQKTDNTRSDRFLQALYKFNNPSFSVHQSESKSVRTSSDKHCRVNTKIDQVKPQKEKVKVSQLQSASSSPDESSYESENDMYHADDNETSRLFKTSIIQDSVFKPASENEMSDIVATSRHIHLSTKDVNIELYERLGWFDNRPVAFWWENLLILVCR